MHETQHQGVPQVAPVKRSEPSLGLAIAGIILIRMFCFSDTKDQKISSSKLEFSLQQETLDLGQGPQLKGVSATSPSGLSACVWYTQLPLINATLSAGRCMYEFACVHIVYASGPCSSCECVLLCQLLAFGFLQAELSHPLLVEFLHVEIECCNGGETCVSVKWEKYFSSTANQDVKHAQLFFQTFVPKTVKLFFQLEFQHNTSVRVY